jgi:hypothetical protein
MTHEEILNEYSSLPSEARREVVDFIAFLRLRYGKQNGKKESLQIEKEGFVGMWKDREDLQDSANFVHEMRRKEWEN